MNRQRLNRRTFIAAFVVGILGGMVLAGLSDIFSPRQGSAWSALNIIFGLLLIGYAIYLLITWIMAILKRLHDIGWPWWVAILFGLLTPFLVALALVPGQRHSNSYGAQPAKSFDLRNVFIWW